METVVTYMRKFLIDLFCGIGGVSWGFSLNGYTTILAMDSWEKSQRVHAEHHQKALHETMSLGTPKSKRFITNFIKRVYDKYPNAHIHVHASPPCQQLSIVNTRKNEKKGLDMTLWTLELLLDLEKRFPITWSIEQVPHASVKKLADTKNVDWAVYEMNQYNVCQKRKRIFITSDDVSEIIPKKTPAGIDKILKVPSNGRYVTNSTFYRTIDIDSTDFKPAISKIVPNKTHSYTVVKKCNWFLDSKQKPIRKFTVKEALLIQSFPESYLNKFDSLSDGDKYQMVANAVPPEFARRLSIAMDKVYKVYE